ncbi:MAG TPA: LamG-like jellyroll fold domain-containing protein [Sumerlaeia bacterium]|nr:LamG-like jellyroll fold domain-containing protein [Sumerlaeia bacterium]
MDAAPAEGQDWRDIRAGREIPTETYSDQPYIVRTDDGAWLCTVTTGAGHEGQPGQHVISMRSEDRGKTWSDPVPVEPADGPEASYAVLLKVPSGRVYCFYNHNTDNRRWVAADDPPFPGGKCGRVDSLGYYVFKYSDDHGRAWSDRRFAIPVREMAVDRENADRGRVRYFWNVGKPFIHDGAAYVSLHKVGGFGHGFFTRSEGVLLKSENLLTEADPEKIAWETLPDGDAGLRAPPGGGPIAEEQSYSVLSDGSFFCVYRTVNGHPACAYSRDGGHTWSAPQYMRFADGRLMKHPRAANFAWRCPNGNYLYWFHNHGGRDYEDRNPVWLCGGMEANAPEGRVIQWSQPEIVLYDDDPYIRISYPDLVEEGGRFFLTETQKDKGRVHEIDPRLLEGLWGQLKGPSVASDTRPGDGLLLALPEPGRAMPSEVAMPELSPFLARDHAKADYGTKDLRQGFSLDLWLRLESLEPGQVLLDSRAEDGRGLCLQTAPRGAVEIALNDGRAENRWDSDPGVIEAGKRRHLTIIVDGGPKVILFVVDGKLCDGGEFRQFGWGRFSPNLRHANGAKVLRIAPHLKGRIETLRIHRRALRVSEAIANFRPGGG